MSTNEAPNNYVAKQTAQTIDVAIRVATDMVRKYFLIMVAAEKKWILFAKGHTKMSGQLADIDYWLTEIERQLAQSPSPDLEETLQKKRHALQMRRQTIVLRPYSDAEKLDDLHDRYQSYKFLHDTHKARLEALIARKAEMGW